MKNQLLLLVLNPFSDGFNPYFGIVAGIFFFSLLYNLFLYAFTKEKSIRHILILSAVFILNFTETNLYGYYYRINFFTEILTFFLFYWLMSYNYLKFLDYFFAEISIAVFKKISVNKIIKIQTLACGLPLLYMVISYFFTGLKTTDTIGEIFLGIPSVSFLVLIIYLQIVFTKEKLYTKNGIRYIALGQAIILSCFITSFTLSFLRIDVYDLLMTSGTVAFLILLSISVADKINHLKIQKAKAQEEAMTLLIANEKINTLLKDQELRSVSNMLDVQESERKRIATDLHDRLGSMLSTVKLYFGSVEEQMDKLKEQNKEQYHKATSLLDAACDEVRKISHDLISGELVKFGLVSALQQLAKTIEDTGQLKIQVLAFGMARLDNAMEITLYRVLQEVMNNILKHSKATEVTIQLNKAGSELNIVVEDNGVGFDTTGVATKDGMGLKNIEIRVSKLNGKVHFDSGKGKGTTVIIDVPV